jgi:hypothetical protein
VIKKNHMVLYSDKLEREVRKQRSLLRRGKCALDFSAMEQEEGEGGKEEGEEKGGVDGGEGGRGKEGGGGEKGGGV